MEKRAIPRRCAAATAQVSPPSVSIPRAPGAQEATCINAAGARPDSEGGPGEGPGAGATPCVSLN